MAGLARWVRVPGPWRPTKLRFDVDTQRCPRGIVSPLVAEQDEQPGSRAVKHAAEDEGLAQVFRAAGFEWREPGCSSSEAQQ